ncbi:MAG: hypothetical protein ACTS3F_02620 [Phycisphaerales bacterium]
MLRDVWFSPIQETDNVILALRKLGVSEDFLAVLKRDFHFERLSLPFYEDFALVRVRCDWPLPGSQHEVAPFRLETFLLLPSDADRPCRPLDTTSPPIHRLNREAPIKLPKRDAIVLDAPDAPWNSNREEVSDASKLDPVDLYARFFCHMVWGAEGPFMITNTRTDLRTDILPSDSSPAEGDERADEEGNREAATLDAIYDEIFNLSDELLNILGRPRDNQAVIAHRVLYRDYLFDAVFAVRTSEASQLSSSIEGTVGYIEMLNDHPLGKVAGDVVRFKKGQLFHENLTWHVVGKASDIENWTKTIPNWWFRRGPKSPRGRGATPEPDIERGEELTASEFLERIATQRTIRNVRVSEAVRMLGQPRNDAESSDPPTTTPSFDQDEDDKDARDGGAICRFNAATNGFDWCGERAITSCTVTIKDVTFEDAFELVHARFASSVSFKSCVFKGAFSLRGATVRGDLTIDQCLSHPSGTHTFSLADAVVEGSVQIEDTQL